MIARKNIEIDPLGIFKYLGTATVSSQTCLQEEIKSRLNSGKACYHAVKNVLSFRLLPKTVNIKMYKTTSLLFFCMGVKLSLLHNQDLKNLYSSLNIIKMIK
jgi:hypothetical protein